MVGILAAGSSKLLGRWRGVLLAGLGIAVYVALTGGQPPVVQAAILGTLSLGAGQLKRRQTGLNSLAFITALMALFNPNVCGMWASSSHLW